MQDGNADKQDDRHGFGRYALTGMRARLLRAAQAMPVNWFGRRGALALRKMVLKSGGGDLIDADIHGLKMRVHTNDNVSERKFLFMPQFFDAFERKLIRDELPKDGVFVDVGANAGIYTLTAAACMAEGGRVIAVEPNPVMVERLRFNIALNGFGNIVSVDESAVADAEGEVGFEIDPTNLGGCRVVTENIPADMQRIPARPLSFTLKAHGIKHIDILKIDIEGMEDMALNPFFRDAPESLYPKAIIIEDSTDQWQTDLPGLFTEKGYTKIQGTRMNTVWRRG